VARPHPVVDVTPIFAYRACGYIDHAYIGDLEICVQHILAAAEEGIDLAVDPAAFLGLLHYQLGCILNRDLPPYRGHQLAQCGLDPGGHVLAGEKEIGDIAVRRHLILPRPGKIAGLNVVLLRSTDSLHRSIGHVVIGENETLARDEAAGRPDVNHRIGDPGAGGAPDVLGVQLQARGLHLGKDLAGNGIWQPHPLLAETGRLVCCLGE